MNYSIIGSSLVFLLLVACQNTPQIQTGDEAEVIQGNLVRVNHSRAKLAYIDPSADFNKYTAILLTPLGVDNVEIVQPASSRRTSGNRNWELTDADKLRLQKDFQASLSKQLSLQETYPLVTAAGDNVLLIAAKLTRIAPTAPKDNNRSRPAGRSKIVTEGAGKISVEVTFSDSETGEVLALAKDTRSGSSLWGLNNSISNQAQVRRVFNSWAMQIRKQLDRVHSYKIAE
ncbi:MAG: DUF3313 family protein [Halioglobus sp.]